MQKIVNIPVDYLYEHPRNPRKSLGDLTELADSIREQGILQNLTVITPAVSYITGVPTPIEHRSEPTYTVVIGHRRLAAAKMAGLKEVPCIVTEMTEKEQIAVMLLENIQRTDLTITEEAEGFRQLRFDMGVSVEDLSKKTGYGQSKIRRRLKIAELPKDAVNESLKRNATLEDIIAVSELDHEENRIEALKTAGTSNFSWKVKSLKDDELREAQLSLLQEKLTEVAEEIVLKDGEFSYNHPDYKHLSWRYNVTLPLKNGVPDNLFDGALKVVDGYHGKYYFITNNYSLDIYIDPKDMDQTSNEVQVDKEKEKELERRRSLDELSDMMDEKRMSFLRDYKIEDCGDWCHKLLHKALLESESVYNRTYEKISENKPVNDVARNSLYLWYSAKSYGSYQTWNGFYNKDLDDVYAELAKMGYEESEDETAWRNGSHELYGKG